MNHLMMFLLALLCVLVPLSSQQCLTSKDHVRKVNGECLDSLLQGELQFSTDMARTVSTMKPGANVFFSPTSVYRALLLAYFLAANHTELSLKKTLHLDSKFDKLDYMGAYHLDNYYQKLRSIMTEGCETNLGNRLYIDRSLKVHHCLRVLFEEELQTCDFRKNFEEVRKKINKWVAIVTNNVIKEFLGEGSISSNTNLVLLNAAYFKGTWKKQFDKSDTFMGKFQLTNGTDVDTLMMTQENEFKFKLDDTLDAEVVELPYDGDDISMFILLPLKQSATALQYMLQKIDGATLKSLVGTFKASDPYKLSVTLPKFTVEETLELIPVLETMGIGDLFQETADLSTLTGSRDLSFTNAVHKAKIKVNEKGTEAAAATALFSARMGTPSIIADKPFAYTIYDKSIDKVLFFGVFNSPNSL